MPSPSRAETSARPRVAWEWSASRSSESLLVRADTRRSRARWVVAKRRSSLRGYKQIGVWIVAVGPHTPLQQIGVDGLSPTHDAPVGMQPASGDASMAASAPASVDSTSSLPPQALAMTTRTNGARACLTRLSIGSVMYRSSSSSSRRRRSTRRQPQHTSRRGTTRFGPLGRGACTRSRLAHTRWGFGSARRPSHARSGRSMSRRPPGQCRTVRWRAS